MPLAQPPVERAYLFGVPQVEGIVEPFLHRYPLLRCLNQFDSGESGALNSCSLGIFERTPERFRPEHSQPQLQVSPNSLAPREEGCVGDILC